MNDNQLIVKVQLPLYSSHGDGEALIYNEDRSEMWQLPVTSDLRRTMGVSVKEFFYAEVVGDELILTQKAPWQSW